MFRKCWCMAVVGACLSIAAPNADARQWYFGVNLYSRPLSVLDAYGVPFNTWYGPPIAFNGSYYTLSGAVPSQGTLGWGYSWGGTPLVASATTSEWVVQRTSIFPSYPYYLPAYSGAVGTPWVPSFGNRIPISPPRVSGAGSLPTQGIAQRTPANVFDALQQHAERRENPVLPGDDPTLSRPITGSSRAGKERSKQFQTEGDRWLREGQNVKAYLRYLEAQREAEDRAEVYFRQAFALVAMGRYSHAVSKLKRGLQIDPTYPQHGETLDEVFGVERVADKVDYLQRVADWANADLRDPDRLFLLGALLHFDEDSRANEFINAAWKLAGGGQHLQAFLKAPSAPPKEAPEASPIQRRELPPPPPPQDEPAAEPPAPRREPIAPAGKPQPNAQNDARGPRLPPIPIPPETKRRELILPDVYLPEENR